MLGRHSILEKIILVLSLLAALVLPASAPAAPAKKPDQAVALVDYHQHLASPAAAELLNRLNLPAPTVELPPDVSRLLRQRAERWNDKAALAELYTEDSLVFDIDNPGWIRGRAAVAAHLSDFFARPFRLTAVDFASQGSAGHVAGYFTRGDEASVRHFGFFYLGLAKGGDGVWRIAVERSSFPGPPMQEPVTGEDLVGLLDAAGIERAVVLSGAYWFDMPKVSPGADAYTKVRAENDWVAQEVAKFPDRLVAFCSFNPLAEYALPELDRCAGNPYLKGLKLHFGGSQVDLKNPEHLAKVRQVFAAANRHRLPIAVHVRADQTYGREHAEIFLNQLLPAAPDIPVQIAHLWGGEAFSESALAAYAEAVSAGHPATKNLYFDVSDAAAVAGGREDVLRTLAQRIRQIGPRRILYGSDAIGHGHPAPREAWAAFRKEIPLTDEEFRIIAGNLAPSLPPVLAKKTDRLVARIDYHQHLVSPAAVELRNRLNVPVPPVELPPELSRLLREKAERWNDKTALADLYLDDSLVFDHWERKWVRGRTAGADHLSTFFARPFRLTPLAFASAGSSGHIAGYFTRGEGPSLKHFGFFYLGLAKSGDGVWRIAVERSTVPGPHMQETITGEQLVGLLNAAGIERAVVLSSSAGFDMPGITQGPEAYANVRADNDWTAQQVAQVPDRLIAFCSLNPLADYALAELDRCAGSPHFKGLKLQLDASGVDYKNPEHVAKLRRVFEASNRHRFPITVHVRPLGDYGREHAEIFLHQILPAAPDVPVQIAHLWGGGAFSEPALATFADAVAAGHPATKNLYFDVSDAAPAASESEEIARTIAQRIRQIGLRRILYGSDAAGTHPPPREAWVAFRKEIPLTEEEFRTIANNVLPYVGGNRAAEPVRRQH
jgi:predicted TIM-barrel fold metal-dependent hydrolase